MVESSRVCRHLAALHRNFRDDVQMACPGCQQTGETCLLVLIRAALASPEAERDPDGLPAPDVRLRLTKH